MTTPVCFFEQNSIALALVNIPEMLKTLLKGTVAPDYQTRRCRIFRQDDFSTAFLSPKELNSVNQLHTLKKQVERMAGRWAVKSLIAGETGQALDKIVVINSKSGHDAGAPVLEPPLDYAISISHSHDHAIAAVIPDADSRIGVDMEAITRLDTSALLHAGFSKKEQQIYQNADLETILKVWTIKEAYLKYCRTGLNRPVRQIEWINGKLYDNHRLVKDIRMNSCISKNIILTVIFSLD